MCFQCTHCRFFAIILVKSECQVDGANLYLVLQSNKEQCMQNLNTQVSLQHEEKL